MRILLPPSTATIAGAAAVPSVAGALVSAGQAAGSPAMGSGEPAYAAAAPREIAAAFAKRSPRPGTFVHLTLFHIRRARDIHWLTIVNETIPQDVARRLQEVEALLASLLRRIIAFCEAKTDPKNNAQIALFVHELRMISSIVKLLVNKDPSPIHLGFEHNFIGKLHSTRFILEELSLNTAPESILELYRYTHDLLILSSSYDIPLRALISYSSHGLGVVMETPPLPFTIARRDHQAKMQDIIWNLLRNAGQHPQDGQNEVAVRVTLDGNRLSFRDNGSGMTPQVLANLRAGIRLHNGERVASGDHGIGLESARHMAEEMGVGLEIDSTLGEGSTFTLILPEGFLKPIP